ncbi:MAG: ATP-binding cassette domain-containing protein [Candidatus Kerfeldbacteria bacterium]|nr:ATP-binding cassette domain-containing protein [Candidatus Kerfeldbacteria bacterium]
MADSVIELRNIKKSYDKVAVLEGINLTVERGTMLALLGPNGAGKTTTVKILSTLLKPDSGEVLVNGTNAVQDPNTVRHMIGLTGQYAAVDELLSGRENLIMMGRLYHLGKEKSVARAQELLEQFELTDAADRAVKTYSGGMRRRLDLAASLVATPPIIFLDEPTTGLDPRSRLTMWKIIQDLMKNGATILLTTQYLEEADQLADYIAVLDKGTIIAHGTADELKSKVGKERTEIVIEKNANFDNAKKLFDDAGIKINEEERSISIPTDGSVRAVKSILDKLTNANIEIDSMSVHKPTLDDVFLELTHHS